MNWTFGGGILKTEDDKRFTISINDKGLSDLYIEGIKSIDDTTVEEAKEYAEYIHVHCPKVKGQDTFFNFYNPNRPKRIYKIGYGDIEGEPMTYNEMLQRLNFASDDIASLLNQGIHGIVLSSGTLAEATVLLDPVKSVGNVAFMKYVYGNNLWREET